MAFIDELKENNLKVMFVEINYKDSLLLDKTIYFSDYVVDIPESLTDGNDLFQPEPRLKKIPYFARTIDLIDNNIVKGSYTLEIENTDNEYTSLFKDNYFKNSKLNFYITIKDRSPFDKLQLAQATIKDIEIGEKTIKLKLDEVNLYQKNSNLEQFNYTNQDEELNEEYKPFIAGTVKDYSISDYNINKAPTDRFLELDATIDLTATTNFSNFLYFKTKEDIENVRANTRIGDKILLPDTGSNPQIYQIVDFFPQDENDESFNLRIELDKPVFKSTLIEDKIKIQISEQSSKNFNNKYFVTSTEDNGQTLEKALLSANFSTVDNYIQIGENWSFLEENDVVFFAKFTGSPSLEQFTDEHLFEEMLVDYFDEVNQRIYVKSSLPLARTKFTSDSWYVCFDKINKVKINDAEPLQKLRNFIEWDLDGKTGSNFKASSDTDAFVIANSIKFQDDSGNNGTEFLFDGRNNLDNRDVNITTQAINNTYGSKTRWIFSFGEKTRSQDIIDALDAYEIANPGVIDFSYTLVANDREVAQSNLYEMENDFYQFAFIIEGGYTTKSFLHFNLEDFTDLGYGKTVRDIIIYFNVDTDTTAPNPPFLTDNARIINVDLNSSDNTASILLKIQTAINAQNLSNSFPLLCGVVDNKIILKFAKHLSFPINLRNNKNDSTTVLAYAKHAFCNFYNVENDNDDLILNIDRDAYNMSFKQYATSTDNNIVPCGNVGSSRVFGASAAIGVAGDFENLEKIFIRKDEVDDELKDATILLKNYKSGTFQYFTNVIEKDQDNILYLNKELFQASYFGYFYVELFQDQEIDEIRIDFKEKSNASDVISDLMQFYNIATSEYSTADLDTIKSNHPNFNCHILIDDEEKMFESLKRITESFNIYTYIDKQGVIRFKFYDYSNSSIDSEIDFNNVISIDSEIKDIAYSKYNLNILNKLEADTFVRKELVNEFTTQLSIQVDFNNIKELDSVIMKDFLTDTFNSKTYADLIGSKYLSKIETIEIIGDLDLITLELGKNLNVINFDKIDSSNIYKITNIETNGNQVKINALRVIENPEVFTFIVDENGNNIIDENENFIIE